MLHDEFAVIKTIQGVLPKQSSRIFLGIGDDAAVVRPPVGKMVATADALVEGVHFDLTYTKAAELGHKALAVNLSDMAAMGATPLYALVSLGLKQELEEAFIKALYAGIVACAKPHKVEVIGGNIVQSPNAVIVDISLIGQTKTYFTRSGAKPGDLICTTGTLGTSAAGLQALKRLGRNAVENDGYGALLKAHLLPNPRLKESQTLKKTNAITSMIDISDGLAKEVHHLCEASGTGAVIYESKIPIHPKAKRLAEIFGNDVYQWALFGGEDYELLFTVNKKKFKARDDVTVIGEITKKDAGIQLQKRDGEIAELPMRGWNHFVRRSKPKHTQAFDIF